MKTRKVTLEALCLAMSLLLPQVFHLLGMAQAGQIFLPMHIPVLMGGLVLGWKYGAFLGMMAPLLSCLFTGMPSAERVIFMMVELMSYGAVGGFLYQEHNVKNLPFGGYIALISAMVIGRLVYGFALVLGTALFSLHLGGFPIVWGAVITGIPGICIQLIFLPALTGIIEKGGYLHESYATTFHSK